MAVHSSEGEYWRIQAQNISLFYCFHLGYRQCLELCRLILAKYFVEECSAAARVRYEAVKHATYCTEGLKLRLVGYVIYHFDDGSRYVCYS